jgi:hypothetical protein
MFRANMRPPSCPFPHVASLPAGQFVACCPPILPSITTSSMVITVGASGAPPGAYTLTLTNVVMGPVTAGRVAGIVVQTTTDLPSDGAPSGPIGGTVQVICAPCLRPFFAFILRRRMCKCLFRKQTASPCPRMLLSPFLLQHRYSIFMLHSFRVAFSF